MEKVALFVDVQNIYYTVREIFQKNFDYNAFWREATTDRNIVAAFAYAIDRGDEKQRQFQHILKAIGFSVKLKPYIQRQDGSAKGDWDVGITIDIMDFSPKVDRVVLLSGDGDFAILMDKIKQAHNTVTEAYGVHALTANALINSVDYFHAITGALLR